MLSTVIASIYSAAASAALQPAGPTALVNKKVEPTTLDWIGTILAFVSLGAAGLVLLGMGIWMTYKALTQSQALQTSWNPPQEQSFQPFADVETKVHGKSWMIALVSAGLVTVLAVGIYFGVTPEKDKIGETMDLTTFDKKGKAPAPAPTRP